MGWEGARDRGWWQWLGERGRMKRESKGQGVGGLAGERENSEGAVGARVGFRVELEVGVVRCGVW